MIKRKSIFMILAMAFALAFLFAGGMFFSSQTKITAYATVDEHSHSGWTEWTSTNSLPSSAGNYYLSNDITINIQPVSDPSIINYSGGSGYYQYLIIDNTGNILYRVNNEEENKIPSEAYGIMIEKDKLNFKVDNGYIYYYRLKKMISLDNQTAILEEVKLSINDGKINITPTGNEKETKVSYN